jgi:PRD1 phage membrane DNA delivery
MGDQIVTVLLALTTVAIVAVVVSRNANTANVITAGGNAFSGALGVAVSPVTGFTGGAAGIGLPSLTSYTTPL